VSVLPVSSGRLTRIRATTHINAYDTEIVRHGTSGVGAEGHCGGSLPDDAVESEVAVPLDVTETRPVLIRNVNVCTLASRWLSDGARAAISTQHCMRTD
jgi:hypothetical protein